MVLLNKDKEIERLLDALMQEKRENARLREALQSIACTDDDCSCVKSFGSPIGHCIYGKARAALGKEEQ